MKFMCLAYEEEEKLDALSAAEWQALRQETLDYVESLRQSNRLIATQPLQSASTASMVRLRNGALSVIDGPFAETKEQIGGFFIVEAAGKAEAIQIAASWPSARIGSIEVRPIEDGLKMDRRYGPAR
jgi:hypothetical protein